MAASEEPFWANYRHYDGTPYSQTPAIKFSAGSIDEAISIAKEKLPRQEKDPRGLTIWRRREYQDVSPCS